MKGIGTAILSFMADEASAVFHRKNGFQECGRFKRIGKKFGQDFDVIWMQKMIQRCLGKEVSVR